MDTDLYSEATSVILSFLDTEGTFQIGDIDNIASDARAILEHWRQHTGEALEGRAILTIEAPTGMNEGKVKQLQENIVPQIYHELGQVPPMVYSTNHRGEYYRYTINAPSVEALKDFLMALMRRLRAE